MSKTPLRSLKAIAVVAGLVFAQGAVLTQQSSPVHANASTAFITVQQAPGVGGAQQLSVTGSGFTPNVPINVVFNAPQGYGLASHAPEPFPAGGTESVPVSVANEGAVPGDTTPESIPVAAPGVGGTSATQTLSETGAPTGGSFTLTFNGSITGSIAFNAAAGPTTTLGTVANMLNALPSVTAAGGVTVIGGPLPGTPDTITFGNAGTQNLITTNSSGLRGGSGTVAPGTPSGSPTTPASDTVSEAGPPTGGGFTLSFNGNTTALIPFSATAAQVAADLNALASVVTAGGVGATGTGLPGAPVVVTFTANGVQPPITGDFSQLTNGSAAVVVAGAAGAGATPPAGVEQSNSIAVATTSDANGNLSLNPSGTFGTCTVTPCPSNAAVIQVPANAVGGVYTITALETSTSSTPVSTHFTIAQNPQMTVNPVYPSVNNTAALGSELNVDITAGGLPNNSLVQFSLDDFLASNDGAIPGLPPNGLSLPGGSVPLKTLSCSSGLGPTTPALPGAPTLRAGTTTACITGGNGALQAVVQLTKDGAGLDPIATVPAPTISAIVAFPDSVYALVARATATVSGTGVAATYTTLGAPAIQTAGFRLDHSLSYLSLSTNQAPQGGGVSASVVGFAANSTVLFYFGGQQTPNPIPGAFPNAPGCAFAFTPTAPFFYTAGSAPTATAAGGSCLVGEATTTASGSAFNVPLTIPASSISSGSQGTILAEDFDPSYTGSVAPPAGTPVIRQNESATAILTINNSSVVTGTLQVSNSAPAVGSTVTFTATGFLPYEGVTVTLTNSAVSTCLSSVVVTTQAGPPLVANGTTATVNGSFRVPDSPCTVTPRSDGSTNAGATVTVTASGTSSKINTSTTLAIPTTAATLTASPAPPQVATTVALSGTGFEAYEPVTLQFGTQDPFTGALTNASVVQGTADANGAVLVNAPLLAGAATGLYKVTAQGLTSGFTASGLQSQATAGFLTVTPTTVLAGQLYTVNGTAFTSTGVGSLFAPVGGNGTLSINFAPVPLAGTQVTISSGGTFVYSNTVPLGTTPGTYTVSFTGPVAGGNGQTQIRTTPIVVSASLTPTLVVTNTIFRIGDTVPFSVTNFAANEPLTGELDYPTGPLSGTTVPGTLTPLGNASATGSLTGTYTLASNLPTLVPGQYNLVVRGTQTHLASNPVLLTVNSTSASASGVSSIYFPEGFTGTTAGGSNANFFETLALLNANNFSTPYTVTYFIVGQSAPIVETGVISADAVITRTVNADVPANSQVAAEVSAPNAIAAQRSIYRTDATGAPLDASSSLGEQLDTVSPVPTGGDNYLFATSDVQLTNEEYLTMLNPTATAATVTITVLPQTAISSTTSPTIAPIVVNVPAMSRFTEPIRKALLSSGLTQYGMSINSTQPVAIERVEYYGDGLGSGKYGTSTKPATAGMGFRQYIFGADYGTAPTSGGAPGVGTGSDLSEVDLINPGPTANGSATVTVSFFDASGNAINSQQVQVNGQTRETVNVNDVVGTTTNVFSVVVTSDKNILAELPISFGGDPSKGGKFAVADPSGAAAGLTSVAFPNLNPTALGSTSAVTPTVNLTQTVNLYNPGAAPIIVRGIYISGSKTVVKTYNVAPNSITAVNVNTDAASIAGSGPVGGIFQIVQNGSGTGNSFVASLTSNTPNYGVVTIDQGTYPISPSLGF